ncbi:MAG: hypothetical protein ACC645_06625 [Pirellulales bacterium]
MRNADQQRVPRPGHIRQRRNEATLGGRRRRSGKTLHLAPVLLAIWLLACLGECPADDLPNSLSPALTSDSRATSSVEPPAKLQAELEAMLKLASTGARYVPTSQRQLQVAERLFARTMCDETDDAALQRAWQQLGWELLPLGPLDARVWVLREQADRKEGRGLFAFRRATDRWIALEAPHAFYDRHTREIALQLFAKSDFVAVGWNTLHRSTYDAAHTNDNCLTSFTRALVGTGSHAMVVQLHGFSQRKRLFAAGATADVILSDGTRNPKTWLVTAGAIMDRHQQYGTIRTFPSEIRELGGTTNAQGSALRRLGSGRFLHIEMSKSLRSLLVRDERTCRQLLKDLVAIYRTSPQ